MPPRHVPYRFPGPAGVRLPGRQLWKPRGRHRGCLMWGHEAKRTPDAGAPAPTLTGPENVGQLLSLLPRPRLSP